MTNLKGGFVAGFAATVVLSVLMVLKGMMAWGGGFAILYYAIPANSAVIKGIVFGIAAWLGMMMVVMPMAGAGLFGMNFGIMAPIMTLVLHFIFGAVLGKVYAAYPAQGHIV